MCEYAINSVCDILSSANIEYVKWDMNRSMADVYASNVTYDYVVGVYDFLEKLTSKYPNIRLKAVVEAAEDLTQECCIILLRSGAVIIQMPLIVPEFSMEPPSSIRWQLWDLMYLQCQIIRPEE